MRRAEVVRVSKETSVRVKVALDGTGECSAKTGVRFLDHMLASLSTHSSIDMRVEGKGDLQHHLVEDVAITLGQALAKALGERRGIRRFGYAIVPMDDALALAAVDLVRRPFAAVDLGMERVMVEDAPREDLEHIFPSLATALEATLHVKVLDGRNDHHKFEAATKALALSLKEAVRIESSRRTKAPSSKGMM